MKAKDLIAALQEFDGEMEVVVRTYLDVDDGYGWHHSEHEDHDIEDVDQSTFNIDNWINPSDKQVIVITI